MINSTTATLSLNLSADLRLLSNRKNIELSQVPTDLGAYDTRSLQLVIERKYKLITEALVGLHDLGVEHSCDLCGIVASFDSI